MKIAFDGRILECPWEGQYRFFRTCLDVLKDSFELHVLLHDNNSIPKALADEGKIQFHVLGPRSRWLYPIWDHYTAFNRIKKIRPNIYHMPCGLAVPLCRVPGVKYVVTINDLIVLRYPEAYTKLNRLRYHLNMKIALRRTHWFMTISEYSKQEMMNYYSIPADRIKTVPYFIQPVFQDRRKERSDIDALKTRMGIDSEYFVYHGGFRAYKNVRKVIQVYLDYRKQTGWKGKLCLIGKSDALTLTGLVSEIQDVDFVSDILFPGFLSDEELSLLLSGAKAFIYLSELEGFGFAPLEAKACGAPVVCTKNSSMPEMLGNSVLWVNDDESPSLIAQKLATMLSSESLKQKMDSDFLQQRGRFSLSAFANRLETTYSSIVNY